MNLNFDGSTQIADSRQQRELGTTMIGCKDICYKYKVGKFMYGVQAYLKPRLTRKQKGICNNNSTSWALTILIMIGCQTVLQPLGEISLSNTEPGEALSRKVQLISTMCRADELIWTSYLPPCDMKPSVTDWRIIWWISWASIRRSQKESLRDRERGKGEQEAQLTHRTQDTIPRRSS